MYYQEYLWVCTIHTEVSIYQIYFLQAACSLGWFKEGIYSYWLEHEITNQPLFKQTDEWMVDGEVYKTERSYAR